ncbi:MAG: ABC transporter permease, partial [Anaerolineae bacterium]|nr:ABC transporter permease [Anaerolineae bacterium]
MRRLEYIIRRLITSIFVLIGVSIITFALARVIPSNPAVLYIGPKARAEDIARVTAQLGLDKSLPEQYYIYMRDLLHGDMGTSISTKRPVLTELTTRLPATLELLFTGMLLAVLIGVPMGVLSARWQGKPTDIFVRTVSI